jgi:hypothetical protein
MRIRWGCIIAEILSDSLVTAKAGQGRGFSF